MCSAINEFQRPTGRSAGGILAARPTPFVIYLAMVVPFVVLIAYVHLFDPVNIVSYKRDVWHHLAVLNELMRDPFNPSNPHVVSDAPSRSFTPWAILIAFVSREIGASALVGLGMGALLSLLLLVTGIYLFTRRYFQNDWAPALFLAAFLGSWAIDINHTGYHTLSTFLFSFSYPYGVVLAVGFISWWWTLVLLQLPFTSRLQWYLSLAALAVAVAFMFAVHQLQAAFAVGGILTFAVFHGKVGWRRRAAIIVSVLVGLGLARLWPYYDVYQVLLASEWRADGLEKGLELPSIARAFGLALVGVLGVYDAQSKRFRADLLVGLGGIAAGFFYAWSTGLWVHLRILPFLVIFLQLGMVQLILNVLRPRPSVASLRRRILRASIIGFVLMFLVFNVNSAFTWHRRAAAYLDGTGSAHFPDWAPGILDAVVELKERMDPTAVAVVFGDAAYPVQAAGIRVVSIPRPFPEVSDSMERQAASARFFATDGDWADRCAVIEKYGVGVVVYRAGFIAESVASALSTLGTEERLADLVLIRIDSASVGMRGCKGST